MNPEDFYPIMKVGFIPDDEDVDKMNPAVLVSNAIYTVEFTPSTIAGLLTSITEAVINLIPDSDQIEFEKKTLKLFNKFMKERHDHIDRFELENEDFE